MLVVHAALFTAALVAQPNRVPEFIQKYTKSVTFYYKDPDPTLGSRMLKDLLKSENLEHPWFQPRKPLFLLIGAQLGDIAAGHAEVVRGYEAAFSDAPLDGQRMIIRALQNCGDKQTIAQVRRWLEKPAVSSLEPELRKLLQHLSDPDHKHVCDQPAKQPKDIDYLWANFFITGEYKPVSRILDIFDLPADPGYANLKRAARFSLSSNFQQHPRLVQLVEKHKDERKGGSRAMIDTLLARLPKS